jgi:hypothetical protein
MVTEGPSGELVPTYQTTLCQNSDYCNMKMAQHYTECFQKSFRTLNAYTSINVFGGHVHCFELLQYI